MYHKVDVRCYQGVARVSASLGPSVPAKRCSTCEDIISCVSGQIASTCKREVIRDMEYLATAGRLQPPVDWINHRRSFSSVSDCYWLLSHVITIVWSFSGHHRLGGGSRGSAREEATYSVSAYSIGKHDHVVEVFLQEETKESSHVASPIAVGP